MTMKGAVILLVRIGGIATAVVALISRADCAFVFGTCSLRNLLAYFTIESAILFTATLTCMALLSLVGVAAPEWLHGARVAVASYVIVSGLVFAILMSTAGYTGAEFLVPMSSRVLHFVLPGFAILDLMLDPPRGSRWPAWATLVFPTGWFVVTAIRGASTGWYPYFFVSVEAVGGYLQLAAYIAGLAAVLLAAFWMMRALGRTSLAPSRGAVSPRTRHAGIRKAHESPQRGDQ